MKKANKFQIEVLIRGKYQAVATHAGFPFSEKGAAQATYDLLRSRLGEKESFHNDSTKEVVSFECNYGPVSLLAHEISNVSMIDISKTKKPTQKQPS